MKLHFLTLTNTSEHANVHELRTSLLPFTLTVIHDYDPKIKNLSKIYKTYEFLTKCDNIDDEDIICIVDGHDVLFNRKKHNERSIIQAFLSFNADIVFSVESNCSHHSDVARAYLESLASHKNRYLNSGVIFAYKGRYVDFLAKILSNMDSYRLPGSFSDQQVISRHLATMSPTNVKLDYDNVLALTLNTSTNVNCYENINACFIHFTFISKSSQLLKYTKFLDYIHK